MPSGKKSSSSSDPVKMARSALDLKDQLEQEALSDGIVIVPPATTAPQSNDITATYSKADVIRMISEQIANLQAETAKKQAQAMSVEAELELKRKKKELEKLNSDSGEQSSPTSSILSSLGGLGGLNSKQGVIKTILESIPPSERAKWIEDNKDLVQAALTGASSLPQKNNQNTAQHPQAEAVSLFSSMSKELREQIAFVLSLREMLSPGDRDSSSHIIDVVRELANQQQTMLQQQQNIMQQITQQFAQSISQITDIVRSLQSENQKALLELQARLVETQKEAYESKIQAERDLMEEKMHMLQEQVSKSQQDVKLPDNLLTVDKLPILKAMLADVGLQVSAQSNEAIAEQRRWDIEEKKLDLEREKILRQMELEEARHRRVADGLDVMKSLITASVEAKKIEKSMKEGGSDAAKKLLGAKTVQRAAPVSTGGGVS